MNIHLANGPFDPQAECAAFAAGRDDAGALVSFIGLCRGATDGVAVSELVIDQYEGFTLGEIRRLAEDVAARFHGLDLLVVHRVGRIAPGEAIVLVAALSVHRADAFRAVEVLMDYLKTDAPLWKKESGPDSARWIEARPDDIARRATADRKTA